MIWFAVSVLALVLFLAVLRFKFLCSCGTWILGVMAALKSDIGKFVRAAILSLRKQTYAELDTHTSELRASVWNDFTKLGRDLVNLWPKVNRHCWVGGEPVLLALTSLADVVGECIKQVELFCGALAPGSAAF